MSRATYHGNAKLGCGGVVKALGDEQVPAAARESLTQWPTDELYSVIASRGFAHLKLKGTEISARIRIPIMARKIPRPIQWETLPTRFESPVLAPSQFS